MAAIILIAPVVATNSLSIVYHLGVVTNARLEDVKCGTKTASWQLERLGSRHKKMQCNGPCQLWPVKNEFNVPCKLFVRMRGVAMNGLGGTAAWAIVSAVTIFCPFMACDVFQTARLQCVILVPTSVSQEEGGVNL